MAARCRLPAVLGLLSLVSLVAGALLQTAVRAPFRIGGALLVCRGLAGLAQAPGALVPHEVRR
jgi:hypothetical protein